MQAIVETLFDSVYLISVITIGILMIRGSTSLRCDRTTQSPEAPEGQKECYGRFPMKEEIWRKATGSVASCTTLIPMIGMLMIPKTCAYVWTTLIGYFAMKQECK